MIIVIIGRGRGGGYQGRGGRGGGGGGGFQGKLHSFIMNFKMKFIILLK